MYFYSEFNINNIFIYWRASVNEDLGRHVTFIKSLASLFFPSITLRDLSFIRLEIPTVLIVER